MPIMKLAFLNPSRCFDEVHNAGCFIGHESLFKVCFWVELGALAGPGGESRPRRRARRLSTQRAVRSTSCAQGLSHGRPRIYLGPLPISQGRIADWMNSNGGSNSLDGQVIDVTDTEPA
jgi:hypothetical protein